MKTDHDFPYALRVKISGYLDGTAAVIDPWKATTNLGPGNVGLTLYNEYYNKTATFSYIPMNVTYGHLTVSYCFAH